MFIQQACMRENILSETNVKLTRFSHGAGCGCKISPAVLDSILASSIHYPEDKRLLVGNSSRDDAAVYDLDNGTALISTTDFFMPIVDDPFDFGCIASANAISDVYAMGGKPILAIAILGWPIDKISTDEARKVLEGSRKICAEAGITLAGGHSIDAPEPIFGLAVNGLVSKENLKQNNSVQENDVFFLTKKIGVGILTTAEKKGILRKEHEGMAARQMMELNSIGEKLGNQPAVHAMTDVTGFGLLGHLTEMCEGSRVSATIYLASVPLICPDLAEYISEKAIPGGTHRNWASYGHKISVAPQLEDHLTKTLLADPQTSGGLLFSVAHDRAKEIQQWLKEEHIMASIIGHASSQKEKFVVVVE
jgi:selenide,water dikinase